MKSRNKLKGLQFFFAYWFPLILYCILIFYVSSIIFLPGPPGLLNDETKHTIEYSVLGILLFRLIENTKYRKFSYLAAILFCLVYGITDEIHQYFVPTRDFSISDIFFDSFGGSLVVIGDWILAKAKRTRLFSLFS